MRVLFVSSANKGSISSIVLMQGRSLERQGIFIDYFGIKGKGIKGYVGNIPILHKYIKSTNPDIIHAHYGDSGLVAFCAKNKKKLIVSFMGDDLLGSNLSDGSMSFKSILLTHLNKFLANRFFSHSIVKSMEMARMLKTLNMSVIPNGVDLSLFYSFDKKHAKEMLGIKDNDHMVIFVSNPIRPEKNFSLADIAIKKIGLPDVRLIAIYNVNHSELVKYYNAADFLILTSLHEGSPNVLKEAMSCNCPIVSTNVGDAAWILGNTVGCYISSFDKDDVKQKILNALNFANRNDRTDGRNRILEIGLDADSVARKIIEVYNKILK